MLIVNSFSKNTIIKNIYVDIAIDKQRNHLLPSSFIKIYREEGFVITSFVMKIAFEINIESKFSTKLVICRKKQLDGDTFSNQTIKFLSNNFLELIVSYT